MNNIHCDVLNDFEIWAKYAKSFINNTADSFINLKSS